MIDAITQLTAQRLPIDDAAEAELDDLIEGYGQLVAERYAAGDLPLAKIYLKHQTQWIAMRTPAHKVRLEAEIMARITGQPCHFDVQGEADAARLAAGMRAFA